MRREFICPREHTWIAVWRNLADRAWWIGGKIGPVSQPDDLAGAASALHVDRAAQCVDLRASEGPQRCSHQKRQAADGGIGRKDQPTRSRKSDQPARCQRPNRRRNQDQTSQHFAHPLHVACEQGASAGWQDCGCALVNLRRVAGNDHRADNPRLHGPAGHEAAGPLIATAHASGCGISRKKAPAVIRRLSFVTPAKHGARAAGFGDGR
jgi:hypothetical protein